MAILHYRVHVLEIMDPKAQISIRQSKAIRKYVITELDAGHWLIDSKGIELIQRKCSQAGINIKVELHV